MLRMYVGVTVALVLAAFAQNLAWMIAASILIGLMASVTHVALPMAPDLVPPERRGRAIGTVMTGLLLGILLARSFAGWLSRLNGWRTVFLVAAVMNACFIPFIYRGMPRMRPRESLTYRETMKSLWTLFRHGAAAARGGCAGRAGVRFLQLFLDDAGLHAAGALRHGPGVAGTFGFVGAAGALTAPLAGRLADKRGTRFVASTAGAVLTASYVLLWLSERAHATLAMHMLGLVIGVVVLDVGAQMMQVGEPDAHLRTGSAGSQPAEHYLHDDVLRGRSAGFGVGDAGVVAVAVGRRVRAGADVPRGGRCAAHDGVQQAASAAGGAHARERERTGVVKRTITHLTIEN